MSRAIGMRVRRAEITDDPGASKFFGDPTVPNAWCDNWPDDVIFFCQLRLDDIAALDKEDRLPHKGYLYIFLDTEMYPYTPMVYYYDGEPDTVIDGFNDSEPGFSHLTQGWLIDFCETEEDADGLKLFGNPSDWCYAEPSPKLFMQFDPLAENMGFMDNVDGFIYFFFDGDDENPVNIRMHVERS